MLRSALFTLGACAVAASGLAAQGVSGLRGTLDPVSANAQHHGFWLGGFAGYGMLDLPGCQQCDSENVLIASVHAGGTLSDRLLLGAEVSRAGNGAGSALPSLLIATVTAYVYPWMRSGFHLKVGAGAAARSNYSNVDGLIGFGVALGAGYDYRISANVSVAPSISWFTMPGDYAVNVVHAGVGITFH